MRGKESVKTNTEQFHEALKSLRDYVKGKTQDSKKAKEATKIISKYVCTMEMEIKARKKELRKKGIKIPSLSSLISQELKKIEKEGGEKGLLKRAVKSKMRGGESNGQHL